MRAPTPAPPLGRPPGRRGPPSCSSRPCTRPPPGPARLTRSCREEAEGGAVSGRPSFTLGIEEEFQTIDPVTREMRAI